MAVSSINRVVDARFVTNLVVGRSPSDREQSSSQDTSAVFKSPSLLKEGLRTGARTFGAAVQNLNFAVSVLSQTEDTLSKLVDVVDQVITLADKASKKSVGSNQRLVYDSEFRRLGAEFARIVSKASEGDLSSISEEDLKDTLKSIGLDSESSESVAKIFADLNLTKSDELVATDEGVAPRPVYYPKEQTFVSSGSFKAAVTLSTASTTTVAGVGDFNNDGLPDIIEHDQIMAIKLGTGNGTFGSSTTIYASGGGSQVATGDFNRDGYLDILDSPVSGGTGVRLSLGNGNGTFSVGTTLVADSEALAFEVVDLNSDGILDIITSVEAGSTSNNLSVFIGNGNGTFQARRTLQAVAEPTGVAVADFTGDGVLDIAALDSGTSATISLFRGNGNGTFAARVTIAAGTTGTFQNFGLRTADVNLDGKADLISTSVDQPAMNVYLGNGNGTFGARVSYALAGPNPWDLDVGDLNGDGIPDVIAANGIAADGTAGSGTVIFFRGQGNGTFTAAQTFTSAGGVAYFPSISDFTGDGVNDIGFGHGGVLNGMTIVASDTVETTARAPRTYTSLFDSTRVLNNRSETFALLADAKAVKKELEENLKAIRYGVELAETNLSVAREAGLYLLELGDSVNGEVKADTLARDLARTIRAKVPGAVEQAENLDPLLSAALLSLRESGSQGAGK